MTTDSQFHESCRWQRPRDLPNEMAKHTKKATGAMDMVKRDRFELLSAYLDGEVTADERKQVEEWLANDAAVQRLYARLLKLRQALRSMPVPTPQHSPETTAKEVFARVNRRSRLNLTFGGAAIAACVIGAISGWLPGRESSIPQLAQQQIQPSQPTQTATEPTVTSSPLMVAINNPVIEIPKAAVSSSEQPVNLRILQPGEIDPGIN
ncbi:anti-sigma factor family protein [Anabaena sp. CA = ATCC 33047]|uniref:anti-sigma factor family protein n=1 Tax=Anabaena sp. (strain CA / ATCC 33047) TaxID=52271 RepID=UPI0008331EC7|nr:zf-HC2 domain-containing protein [Anabaena sp. CA = ATCC 33047]